ncbi:MULTISPECIES: MGDG synthase family glycosyltransferase [Limnochorda]|uniref:MGDG synthase family glycosyltransferase n=1 Tax=Limnochorda TaxID=1676651 RepID=UPI0017EE7F8B|nr:glycosyltransferase [Limnochorda pilosa]MBO2486470.1 UDP-N-acetylglucosamine--LPS N-acetylglucosamine transferase [Bacillota bacterium]NMA72427.1 glycosyltransferase [Bacillota bacterium]
MVLLEASYGGGHAHAAAALAASLAELAPSLRVERVDVFDRISPALNEATRYAYIQCLIHVPLLWREVYERTRHVPPDSPWQLLDRAAARRVGRFLAGKRPRAVVATHPGPARLAGALRAAGQLDAPVFAVVTDYVVHGLWAHPGVDWYLVGHEAVRDGLTARGIDPARVAVTGIPIHPRFGRPADRERLRRAWQLGPEPVVLFMAGSAGLVRGMEDACRALVQAQGRFQLLVVAGRDGVLERRLRAAVAGAARPARVLGFVDRVDELMSLADLLLSKAGGLTVSEALAKGLPMVIYRPIPGQEEGNAAFLVAHGAARVTREPQELVAQVQHLLRSPGLRAQMAAAASQLGRPQAGLAAAGLLLEAAGLAGRDGGPRRDGGDGLG